MHRSPTPGCWQELSTRPEHTSTSSDTPTPSSLLLSPEEPNTSETCLLEWRRSCSTTSTNPDASVVIHLYGI
ncbi:Accessory subunit of protein NADH:ubiquinone oxidoreductase (Complex I) [Yarrowia lipolytica]|nr:Accessory subunit of protein NADH:ubiquinone oxidoreductase (Complex I) [Yarrowia lipolytica]